MAREESVSHPTGEAWGERRLELIDREKPEAPEFVILKQDRRRGSKSSAVVDKHDGVATRWGERLTMRFASVTAAPFRRPRHSVLVTHTSSLKSLLVPLGR